MELVTVTHNTHTRTFHLMTLTGKSTPGVGF